jgi:glycine/D-amino acid oxidase-like deaminating enzyme
MNAIVVGGGVFGVAAAWSLAARGWGVTLVESGFLPDPRAASTDISKLVRADYGTDAHYFDMMRAAMPIWRRWGAAEPGLFHDDGVLFLTEGRFEPQSFEATSRRMLAQRGGRHADVDPRRFGWNVSANAEAYVDHDAGWASSGAVVAWMAQQAREAGAQVRERAEWRGLIQQNGRTIGVDVGERLLADAVVIAAGTWTRRVVPELDGFLRSTAQPVLHFAVNPAEFRPPQFLPWAFDISRTGWYGFPSLEDGTLKIAHHGRGWDRDPNTPRVADAEVDPPFRTFLAAHLPQIHDAPIRTRKLCLYCDTPDGDFLIDRHPRDAGLILATGGSGHAFKFAPLLGDCVADAVEAKPNAWNARFRWRAATPHLEAARCDAPLA